LKKAALLVGILIAAWSFYERGFPIGRSVDAAGPERVARSMEGDRQPLTATSRFRCDGRVYCSQMTSRAEAEFFVRNCPNTKMDGDGDGIPCENDTRF
jgi:hypothetical protein